MAACHSNRPRSRSSIPSNTPFAELIAGARRLWVERSCARDFMQPNRPISIDFCELPAPRAPFLKGRDGSDPPALLETGALSGRSRRPAVN
jgi:hypothetical protein